jgi:MipA family protein
VDNAVVSQMDEINGTVEGGAFVAYRLKLSQARMHQITFTADLAGGKNGVIGGVRALYWQPLSQATLVNIGLGMSFVNDKWMRTYFGVTSAHDIALFPSLGGMPYSPGGGLKGVTVSFGLTHFWSREWGLALGGRYEKLENGARDSPITSQQGSSNQWIFGAGVFYLF